MTKKYHHRKGRRAFGTVAGFLLLVLIIVFILQHEKIENWYLQLTSSFGTKLADNNGLSSPLCVTDPAQIPEYSGELSVELNDNIPFFSEYDLTHITGETYSDLDSLGRCGSAVAMLDKGMMPTEERGEIGMIRPSGWKQNKYPGIIESEPPYLYHRSHLIAYALTGQNANEKNLITGTQYMNTKGMLPWEIKVARYLDNSDHHVLYRVTPYFKGEELLCRGVEMEAYSVEDSGRDLCFHVFVYDIQPGIVIDYQTGGNRVASVSTSKPSDMMDRRENESSGNDIPAACALGAQPERKENDR